MQQYFNNKLQSSLYLLHNWSVNETAGRKSVRSLQLIVVFS